jgi:hypothetical protein
MRIAKLTVKNTNTGKTWSETYKEGEGGRTFKPGDDIEQWARDLIGWFNSTLRECEAPRELVSVMIEITDDPPLTGKGFVVQFSDVGRGKQSWSQRITRPVTDSKLVKAVKDKKALVSRGIDVEETGDYAGIFVTGGCYVGKYRILMDTEVK